MKKITEYTDDFRHFICSGGNKKLLYVISCFKYWDFYLRTSSVPLLITPSFHIFTSYIWKRSSLWGENVRTGWCQRCLPSTTRKPQLVQHHPVLRHLKVIIKLTDGLIHPCFFATGKANWNLLDCWFSFKGFLYLMSAPCPGNLQLAVTNSEQAGEKSILAKMMGTSYFIFIIGTSSITVSSDGASWDTIKYNNILLMLCVANVTLGIT